MDPITQAGQEIALDGVVAPPGRTDEDQVEAVRATGTDTPIQWHIAEKDTFDTLRDKQDWGKFPAEIELIHTPPN